MARHGVLACLITLLAVSSAEKEQKRWSRQISSYTSDISDWVPLPGPVEREPLPFLQIKRQAVAEPRILSEPIFQGFSRPTGFSQDFPSRTYFNSPTNRQLYLQSVPAVPSAPQNYLSDQGFRFGLQQPNFPLSQGFVSPQLTFDNAPQIKQRPQTASNLVSFPKSSAPLSAQAKPFINQAPKRMEAPKFVDGYRVENASSDFSGPKRKPQSLQKLKFESYDKVPKTEMIPPNKPKVEREEVQLLYVPLESLNRGQFNFRNPLTSTNIQNNDPYVAQNLPKPTLPKQTFAPDFQRPIPQPLNTFGTEQDFFSNFNTQYKDIDQVPKFSTISSPLPTSPSITPKPKKLKPHQPPLAIFLTLESNKGNQIKVGDVLSSLKNANTIAVLDSVNPLTAPKVFIGPSTLDSSDKFVKFELPYLSNIEQSENKIRQLPFFVAPLSYNTPQGFAKIPFPSPHVGSVVINSQIRESNYPTTFMTAADILPNSYSTSPQSYSLEPKPVTQKPSFSYYSTAAPKTNSPGNYQSNYYSFEPQTVSTVRPPLEPQENVHTTPSKPGSYFLSNREQYIPSHVKFQSQKEYKTSEPQYETPKPSSRDQYIPSHVKFQSQKEYKTPEPSNRDQFIPSQVKFQSQKEHENPEPIKSSNIIKSTAAPITPRTTVSSTTLKPSTYPSQLLETHNPYSINQAFHFSTPLDYHNFFDESYTTPSLGPQQQPSSSPIPVSRSQSSTPKPVEPVTERQIYQSSPNYLQNYSPEIHYESENQNSGYPVYNTDNYSSKPELTSQYSQQASLVNAEEKHLVSSSNPPTEYNRNVETQRPANENTETVNEVSSGTADTDVLSTRSPYSYNQYETNYGNEEKQRTPTTSSSTTISTTTTTTTKKTPLRGRGRPRYTTARPDSNESTTRTVVTRRPLRERKPLPTRPKYEHNKVTTERVTRKPVDSNESTTKYSRSRTRGRVHFKPSESEDYYNKPNKGHGSKDADLAYQRDVLHQNYPVTLMERTSTVDIEAITEPSLKFSSTKNVDASSDLYDTENAYSNDRASISQHPPDISSKEETPTYTSRSEIQTETLYFPKLSSTNNEEYGYQSRSSLAPVDAISSFDETSPENEEDTFAKQTTPVQKGEKPEIVSYATEPSSVATEQNLPNYSINNDFLVSKQEEITTTPDVELSKLTSEEASQEEEAEENVVQTTPSYNRVRVRPGVIRQYHQASSTESARIKSERRRPVQTITYRPAFDRRRTTMRIEEIEADLKTKQVHARPDVQDHRHPVYRPEATTEPSVTSQSTQETATKRGVFRRRRPTYTTTSTEASNTKKNSYEVKNRFRGRRPTEKPTGKPEVQTDVSTTTTRNALYSRYSNRPRLSERYNKKPESEDSEDQDSNHSINRPKYVEPESDQWSPKISTDSFKPYNPNDIVDEEKVSTDRKSSNIEESDLDIITARNDDEEILISVTPATNSRVNKKIPDIPPTLEALVEQSKFAKQESGDAMSTFETMLEEVMKSLEEQDEDEYTKNVMKHKGGEIGEIPPERIISSGDNYQKTTAEQQEVTTVEPTAEDSGHSEEEVAKKSRRRGFWKKVKVRPTTETIETAESQFYHNTVNRLGQTITLSKTVHDKSGKYDKPKVTTYKPSYQFNTDLHESDSDDDLIDVIPTVDIPKINNNNVLENKSESKETTGEQRQTTEANLAKETPTEPNPGDMDLGTGSPDPTEIDTVLYTTSTEPDVASVDRSDGFSFMDYLFGVTSHDDYGHYGSEKIRAAPKPTEKIEEIEITTEQAKSKPPTTENSYIPEELTTSPPKEKIQSVVTEFEKNNFNSTERITAKGENTETTEESIHIESSSMSSFMDPTNFVSTSMSTEISHETEICFRGKCIKTNKDLL